MAEIISPKIGDGDPSLGRPRGGYSQISDEAAGGTTILSRDVYAVNFPNAYAYAYTMNYRVRYAYAASSTNRVRVRVHDNFQTRKTTTKANIFAFYCVSKTLCYFLGFRFVVSCLDADSFPKKVSFS